MKDRPQVQDFDWVLLAIVAAINALGVLEIYSSTHASAMAGMQWKQLMWLGIGLICMFLISRVDYHTLLDQAPMLYIAGVLGLLVVLVIGFSRLGAKRWISLGGGFNFQVSEPMKLIIIIVLARYFSEVRTDRLTLGDLLKVGIITAIPVALILKQPDLGTAVADWAQANGFSSAKADEQVQQWAEGIQKQSGQATLEQKALAELALKHYGAAAQLFNQAGDADRQQIGADDAEEQAFQVKMKALQEQMKAAQEAHEALVEKGRNSLSKCLEDSEQAAGADQLNRQYHEATQTLEKPKPRHKPNTRNTLTTRVSTNSGFARFSIRRMGAWWRVTTPLPARVPRCWPNLWTASSRLRASIPH